MPSEGSSPETLAHNPDANCASPEQHGVRSASKHAAPSRTAAEIESWLREHLAAELNCPSWEIDPTLEFSAFSLDSLKAVRLSGELEEWLGQPISPTLVWDYPTIERAARYLGSDAGQHEEQDETLPAPAEPIALVGMSCRFAGAEDLAAFLHLLQTGGDGVRETPADRWSIAELYDPRPETPGKTTTRWGGFLDRVDEFDPGFFGITPREAQRMDPQQRVLVETAWSAFEHAGYPRDRFAGSQSGVFIGIGGYDYSTLQSQYPHYRAGIDAYTGTGNTHSIAANRLSYLFDLRGPSLACDTACSSGLLALHLACQSLRNRECDLALAGAVNLILSPEVTIAFSKANMLSPDGRCKSFDDEANGYVRGEGCAVLVIKRLADAERDGDQILAVLRGSATNQDGRTSGITAPSGPAQKACIRSALRQAGLKPDQVGYIEAHGTGTPLGDPIEINSLNELLGPKTGDRAPCYFGSVKANIGHTETVSGLAGVIKVALMMQQRSLFPQLHFQKLNRHITLDGGRLVLSDQLREWPDIDGRRIAGVSSFGFGGANVHVVLEEYAASSPRLHEGEGDDESRAVLGPQSICPGEIEEEGHGQMRAVQCARPPFPNPLPRNEGEGTKPIDIPRRDTLLLTISAKSEPALRELAQNYRDAIHELSPSQLADFCYTANAHRTHFPERLAISGETVNQFQQQLDGFLNGQKLRTIRRGLVKDVRPPKIAFLFTGQGAQSVGMGRRLFQSSPVFRAAIEKCDAILQPVWNASLRELLYESPANDKRIHQTRYAQPAIFAVEYALAQLWQSWGITPSVLLGHSVGEYVAACLAGVFPLEAGLMLVAERARLMNELPANGKIAAVLASAADVEPWLPVSGGVTIAAYNGPKSVVISGAADAVDEAIKHLAKQKIGAQPLQVSHAFHSSLMEPMLDSFREFAASFTFGRPSIPLISNVTGRLVDAAEPLDADYWTRHVRHPVKFAEGAAALEHVGTEIYLEIGPAPQLIGLGKTCVSDRSRPWVGSLKPGNDDWTMLLDSLATLYVTGADIDWERFDRPYRRSLRTIPGYPFQRQRYWMDPPAAPPGTSSFAVHNNRHAASAHPLLGHLIRSAAPTLQFESEVSLRQASWLGDHRIHATAIMPAAAYLEAGFAALRTTDRLGSQLGQVRFHEPLVLPADGSRLMQFVLAPEIGGQSSFQIYSQHAGNDHLNDRWTLHVTGTLTRTEVAPKTEDISSIRARCSEPVDVPAFYAELAQRGLNYGPAFQGITALWRGDKEALGEVAAPGILSLSPFEIHPALLDAAFHVLAAAITVTEGEVYLPVGVRSAKLFRQPPAALLVHARQRDVASAEMLEGDITLCDADGQIVAFIAGLKLQRLPVRGEFTRSSAKPAFEDLFYRTRWLPQPLDDSSAEPRRNSPRPWLILADQSGTAARLAELLRIHGNHCIVINSSADPNDWKLPQRLWDADCDPAAGFGDVVDLGCADVTASHPAPLSSEMGTNGPSQEGLPEEPVDLLRTLCDPVDRLATLVKQLTQQSHSPRLMIVTWQCHQVNGEDVVSLRHTPIVGLFRTIVAEHPELRATHIDLDAHATAGMVAQILWDEMNHADGEDQIAWRNGQRSVLRLERIPPEDISDSLSRDFAQAAARLPEFRLEVGRAGTIDSLTLKPVERAALGAGEVEVEVRATGLNFSDVLKAMQLYPGAKDDVVPLGIECAGVITAVSENCGDWSVGDEVLALAPYCFARHVCVPVYGLMRKPANLSFTAAATLPVAYLTAHYALVHLARLSKGERVLIHTAAGGVGQAAIVIARQSGAEIFATAGSDEKRDFLKSQGVSQVFDSRSLSFAEEIRAATSGQGVDVVLNSLPGDAMTESLRVLAPYGRFLELGKTDIYLNRPLGLEPFQNNLSYFAIDMDRIYRQRTDLIRRLAEELSQRFQAGDYHPIVHTEFSIGEVTSAFRYMSLRKNTGKVVVSIPPRPTQTGATQPATEWIAAHATYLITGGLGGLGLQLAKWLVDQGAKSLALGSRNEPSPAATSMIQSLRKRGVQVATFSLDMTNPEAVRHAIAGIQQDLPPLAGVFHLAGVLDDGIILRLTRDRWERVMHPKACGAWNLHQATLDVPLRHFVCFSSAASLLGSSGQANYAAANAFLDGLVQHRQRLGLPGLSINWGAWASAGMASAESRRDEISHRGFSLLDTDTALAALKRLLTAKDAQAAVMAIDWPVALKPFQQRIPPMVSGFATGDESVAKPNGDDAEFLHQLRTAAPEQRLKLLTDQFRERLVQVTGLSPAEIDASQPLNSLGLDSLMVFELKNSMESQLQITIPVARLFENPSLSQLAEWSLEQFAAADAR